MSTTTIASSRLYQTALCARVPYVGQTSARSPTMRRVAEKSLRSCVFFAFRLTACSRLLKGECRIFFLVYALPLSLPIAIAVAVPVPVYMLSCAHTQDLQHHQHRKLFFHQLFVILFPPLPWPTSFKEHIQKELAECAYTAKKLSSSSSRILKRFQRGKWASFEARISILIYKIDCIERSVSPTRSQARAHTHTRVHASVIHTNKNAQTYLCIYINVYMYVNV